MTDPMTARNREVRVFAEANRFKVRKHEDGVERIINTRKTKRGKGFWCLNGAGKWALYYPASTPGPCRRSMTTKGFGFKDLSGDGEFYAEFTEREALRAMIDGPPWCRPARLQKAATPPNPRG